MVKTALLVSLGEWTNRTFTLPIVVFFPTSRCNSRCLSCDWWKASGEGDLSMEEVARVAAELPALGIALREGDVSAARFQPYTQKLRDGKASR